MPGLAVGGRRLVCDSAGGWRDRVMAGRTCPGVQMISRGRRPRAKCQTARSGVLVGRWTLILVFISTMRAAMLIRRSLRVSNWATRQDECLGISVRRLHSSQQAPACRNSRNWLAVALGHEV